MPRYVNVTTDELEVGLEVTAWRMPDGNGGQGGTITRLAESFLELHAGANGEFHHTIAFADVHHFTVEHFLDADECVEFHQGDCAGVVDYCYAPSGSNIRRCVHHNDKRWREYEADTTSVARFANSTFAPEWFDESAIGEHWNAD